MFNTVVGRRSWLRVIVGNGAELSLYPARFPIVYCPRHRWSDCECGASTPRKLSLGQAERQPNNLLRQDLSGERNSDVVIACGSAIFALSSFPPTQRFGLGVVADANLFLLRLLGGAEWQRRKEPMGSRCVPLNHVQRWYADRRITLGTP